MQAVSNLSESIQNNQSSQTRVPCKREVLSLFGITVHLSARTITLVFTIFGIAWVLVTSLLSEQHLLTGAFFVM